MYLIYGEDDFLVKKETKKIIKNHQDKKLVVFNQDTSFIDIINEISILDLFENAKIILVKNSLLLESKKVEDQLHQQDLIDLIKQKETNIKIIFMQSKQLNKTQNILTKFLFEFAKIIAVVPMAEKDLPKFVKSLVESKGGTINLSNATLLCSQLPNNINAIITEIDRLMLENKNVSFEMIANSGTVFVSNNPFEFINSFTSMDSKGVIEVLQKQILNGESIINLIGQISQMLILSSRIHSLIALSYTKMQMENYLKIHQYRIKIATEFLDRLGYEKIVFLIEKLAQLDSDIKLGKINEIIGFNNFVLNFFK